MKIDPYILSQAAQLFNLHVSDLRPLGGMEGMALEFKRDGDAYVLKITHSAATLLPAADPEPDSRPYSPNTTRPRSSTSQRKLVPPASTSNTPEPQSAEITGLE